MVIAVLIKYAKLVLNRRKDSVKHAKDKYVYIYIFSSLSQSVVYIVVVDALLEPEVLSALRQTMNCCQPVQLHTS